MSVDLCIYEDEKAHNFSPLTLTRPVQSLKCGMFSLLQKLVRHFPGHRVRFFVRKELVEVFAESRDDVIINEMPANGGIFINSRFILHEEIADAFESSVAFYAGGACVGAYLSPGDLGAARFNAEGLMLYASFVDLPRRELKGKLVSYPWDLVHENADELRADFKFVQRGGQILGKVYPSVTLLAQENVYLALGAQLHPGVVIDGEAGPVYISEGAVIMANAMIEGPAFIGKNTKIKVGAKIYGGTTIGDVCKVGGEVEESILHGYSNKQHDGFLGHAYLGEWINLGADTNNSDLKNNYGPVSVPINGKLVNTGSTFVGLFMGDHSKSGINTMFNTGTVVEVMCNVFGGGYAPKYIPSFSWGCVEKMDEYTFSKAIETARAVMARRGRELTPAQERLLKHICDQRRI